MELKQLRYFTAVAETRQISRAAEQLRMSQPPLTRHIQQLESELGVKLFHRTPHGMELTQAGAELLEHARSIRGLVSQAAERTRRAGRGEIGRLDIGVYGSSIFGIVPQVLTAFGTVYPDVEIALHYAQTPQQLPALRQRRVAIVFERLLPEDDDIEIELVAREPLLLALAERHPLADLKRVDVSLLRSETILLGTAPAAFVAAMDLCRSHGFEPRLAPQASDVITATLLVAANMGVTLVPASMANVKFPGITYRPLKTSHDIGMDLHCYYLKGEKSPLLEAMLRTIRSFRQA